MSSSSGSGLYKGGGYLSSFSNLSASAPPFKVDKTLPKSNSIDPSTCFPKVPTYGTTFDHSTSFPKVPTYGTAFDPAAPSFTSSISSPASGPKFVASETRGTNAITTPFSSLYAFPSSQQPSNTNSNVCHVTPNPVSSYDPFSYDQFSNSMCTTNAEGAKPYYPSYAPHSPRNDGYSGIGVAAGHNFDLLSTSGSANLEGCGSSHLDHLQGVYSGGDYKPKWDSCWTGVNDSEHGTWTEYAQGFSSKDTDLSRLSTYKSHLSVDGNREVHPFVDGNSKVHPSGGMSSNKGPLKSGGFDVFSGPCTFGNLGIDQQRYKSSFDLNLGLTSTDCTIIPNFSASASDGNPNLCEPVLESVSNTLEENFRQPGTYFFGGTSTASSFPTTVKKLPYSGSITPSHNAFSVTKATPVEGDAVYTSDGACTSFFSTGYADSCQAVPQIPTGLKSRSNVIIRKPPSFSAASSTPFRETVKKPDCKDTSDCPRSTPRVRNQFSSRGQEIDDVEAIYCAEKQSGGSDIVNLAEDSPCWRGASSIRFSPFLVPESDAFLKNLDGCDSPISQDTQNESILVDGSDSMYSSSRKTNEKGSLDDPSVLTGTSKVREDVRSMSPKSHRFNLNANPEVHLIDIRRASSEDLSTLNKAKTDSDPSLDARQVVKDGEVLSARHLSEVPSCSPPHGDKSCFSPWEVSDLGIDLNMLLKIMINLSKVFQRYCFSNPDAVMEGHSDLVKQMIDNLTNSLLFMAGSTPPSVKVSSQSEMACTPEAAAATTAELCERANNFLGSVLYEEASNSLGLDTMTEAMKKILHEYFHEEDMDQQALLYKKLWLEAEAASCSLTARTRLQRVKIEMEKSLANNTKDMEKQANSDISSDVHGMLELSSKAKGLAVCGQEQLPSCSTTNHCDNVQTSTMNKPHIPDSLATLKSTEIKEPKSATTDHSFHVSDGSSSMRLANDVESSIAARYQILKHRIDKSCSMNYDNNLPPGKEKCLPDKDYSSTDTSAYDLLGSGLNNHADDVKSFDQIQENNLLDDVVFNPTRSFHNSLFNSVNVSADNNASIPARFNILQSQINGLNSNSIDKDPPQGHAVGSGSLAMDVTRGSGWSECNNAAIKDIIGPFLDSTKNVDLKEFGICGNGEASNKMRSEIFEGWYSNSQYPLSSSDWEHVSKEELRR